MKNIIKTLKTRENTGISIKPIYEFLYGEQTLYWEPDLKPGDEVSIESEYWEGSEQPFPAFAVDYYPYSPSPTPSQSFAQSLR